MRKLLVFGVGCAAILSLCVSIHFASAQKSLNAENSGALEERISRVQNGLLPNVVIKGTPSSTLHFVVDQQGHVGELVINQDGESYHGKKIK